VILPYGRRDSLFLYENIKLFYYKYNKITKFICWVHQKINNLNDKNMLGTGLIEGAELL